MEGALLSGLIGAVAAVVGFGLAGALRGPIARLAPWPAWRKYGHIAVGAVLFVVVLALGRGLLTGGGDKEERAMRELRSVPFMAAILDADPTAEAEIRSIVRDGVRSNNQQQIAQRFAQFTATRLPAYFKAASDESVVAFAAAMVPLFKELERTDADACKQAILSGAGMSALNSQGARGAMADRLMPAMAEIVRSATIRPQAAPDAAKAQIVLTQAMQNLYAKPDARLVPAEDFADPGRMARAAADRLCYTGGRIYETIVALPRADASLALRYMLAGG